MNLGYWLVVQLLEGRREIYFPHFLSPSEYQGFLLIHPYLRTAAYRVPDN